MANIFSKFHKGYTSTREGLTKQVCCRKHDKHVLNNLWLTNDKKHNWHKGINKQAFITEKFKWHLLQNYAQDLALNCLIRNYIDHCDYYIQILSIKHSNYHTRLLPQTCYIFGSGRESHLYSNLSLEYKSNVLQCSKLLNNCVLVNIDFHKL